ncbi:hypothetical protein [Nocardia sp. BMG51109]|uniref:hypothetical protein n=1 Tax=Nocardia sp. BMG51109 TaxID=1056816 RepID=UPI0012EC05FA|nr:hypothetical protein [Nocardia sp. BMG51109]
MSWEFSYDAAMGARGGYGPIKPEHADNGWIIEGDQDQRWLSKDYGDLRGRVKTTAPTACAWRITTADGAFLREASSSDVHAAKAAADDWVADYRARH